MDDVICAQSAGTEKLMEYRVMRNGAGGALAPPLMFLPKQSESETVCIYGEM